MVNQVREHGWSLDACVGRAKKKKIFPEEQIFYTSTLYDAVWAVKIPGKYSASVMTAMEVLREEYGEERFTEIIKTITADNGSEFDTLSELEVWGIGVYFAHPYSSWDRAQNEHHNRLFRIYVPKGVSIDNYSAEQLLSFADEMNAMQQKHLG